MKWSLLATALLLGGIGVVFAVQKKTSDTAAAKASAMQWQTAAPADVRRCVEATGIVTARRTVEIKAKASGEVIRLPFDVSDSVPKGALLAELDPDDSQRELQRAEINTSSTLARLEQARLAVETAEQRVRTELDRARANLQSAVASTLENRRKAERAAALRQSNLSSQQDLEAALASEASAIAAEEGARIRLREIETEQLEVESKRRDVVLAEAELQTARLTLADKRERLQETQIYAPIAGVLSELHVQEGQIISSGISNVGGGTTLMVLSDLGQLFVLASVDESDIGAVRVGLPVLITCDAFPDETFEGVVQRVAVDGISVSDVVTFETKIEVTSANRALLKPQMTTSVSIILEEAEGVLAVPLETLIQEGGETYVQVKGETTRRRIATGLSDAERVQVLSGLRAGEHVAVQGSVASKWKTESSSGSFPPPPPI